MKPYRQKRYAEKAKEHVVRNMRKQTEKYNAYLDSHICCLGNMCGCGGSSWRELVDSYDD